MTIVSIAIQSLLGLLFLMASFSKIIGAKQHVETFNHLKLPQWFRMVTGLVQLIGVVGLVIGYWIQGIAALSGLWIGITMLFGAAAHIRVKDPISKAIPAFVFAILAITVTVINLTDLLQLFS